MELRSDSYGMDDPRFNNITCEMCGCSDLRDEPPTLNGEPFCDECFITEANNLEHLHVHSMNDICMRMSKLKSKSYSDSLMLEEACEIINKAYIADNSNTIAKDWVDEYLGSQGRSILRITK